MKPVESYSAINTRMDRPVPNEVASKKSEPSNDIIRSKDVETTSTTASKLAAANPPFDSQKVAEIRERIASGSYSVDTDALANKMLEVGVLGVETKK